MRAKARDNFTPELYILLFDEPLGSPARGWDSVLALGGASGVVHNKSLLNQRLLVHLQS